MTLGELIEFLETKDLDKIVPLGFYNPHSYRGNYYDLAFEPKENVTVGQMLASARDAGGKTYNGWKGGEYKMDEYTDVWLAEQGSTGESIGPILLRYMLKEL